MNMTPEQLKCICDLVVELVRLRQNECKHLCVENVAPEILAGLIMAYNRPEIFIRESINEKLQH